jgi:cyclopropane fatty-acyl-phospholipid synthase-like methyltransferase
MATLDYYNKHYKQFIESTLDLDMSELYEKFEKYLNPGDKVLDIGCGPGRDLKYFSLKYKSTGIEPSEQLAYYASNYTQTRVEKTTINDFETDDKFNGVWACSSLLHLKLEELPGILCKISSLMTDNGAFYCSFKYGQFQGDRNGRYFTDLKENDMKVLVKDSGLTIQELWITRDVRKGREDEKWLNCLLAKEIDE